MMTYEFTLIVAGSIDDEALIMKLYDICDDATFSMSNGVSVADFAREAATPFTAVLSAIQDLASVGLRTLRVEPDDLVTIPEIADRLQRSPEFIRLLANGERGGGKFPLPVSHLVSRHRLWRWSDVAAWAGTLSQEELHTAVVIAAFNAMLELSRIGDRDPDLMKDVALAAQW